MILPKRNGLCIGIRTRYILGNILVQGQGGPDPPALRSPPILSTLVWSSIQAGSTYLLLACLSWEINFCIQAKKCHHKSILLQRLCFLSTTGKCVLPMLTNGFSVVYTNSENQSWKFLLLVVLNDGKLEKNKRSVPMGKQLRNKDSGEVIEEIKHLKAKYIKKQCPNRNICKGIKFSNRNYQRVKCSDGKICKRMKQSNRKYYRSNWFQWKSSKAKSCSIR